jgi:NADH-quinone oxidoreductase subunit J
VIVVFYILALLALAGAGGVLLARSTVKAALSLLVTFLAVACLYLSLEAELLAALQVLVYAGAVLVLFLFVIMLLAGEGEERGRWHPFQRLAGLVLAGVFVLLAGQVFVAGWVWTGGEAAILPVDATRALAMVMFTRYLLPFEATSLLLLAAVVGAVVLAGRKSPEDGEAEEGEE